MRKRYIAGLVGFPVLVAVAITARIAYAAPVKPAGLACEATKIDRVVLRWTNGETYDNVNVFVSATTTFGGSVETLLGSPATFTIDYSKYGLQAGKAYYYMVRGVKNNQWSDSNVAGSCVIVSKEPNNAITVNQGANVTIEWNGDDPDNAASVSLAYDNDKNYDNGGYTFFLNTQNEDGTYAWNTTNVPVGPHYILNFITDGSNVGYHYSELVTIQAAGSPTFTPTSPTSASIWTKGVQMPPATWNQTGFVAGQQVTLDLHKGTQRVDGITAVDVIAGQFNNWIVNPSADVPPGNDYRVRWIRTTAPTIDVYSPYFTIQDTSRPNLKIASITGNPNPAVVNTRAKVVIGITNSGTAASQACYVDVYKNRSTVPSGPGDASALVPAINPGQTATVEVEILGATTEQTWTTWAFVDQLNDIQESNETDNTASYTQQWTTPQTFALNYLHAHGESGFIAIEYNFTQPTGLPPVSSAPTFSVRWINTRDSSDTGDATLSCSCMGKRTPLIGENLDSYKGSYQLMWNSRASRPNAFGEEYQLELVVTVDGRSTPARRTQPFRLYNRSDAQLHRRSLFVGDAITKTGELDTVERLDDQFWLKDFLFNTSPSGVIQRAAVLDLCNVPSRTFPITVNSQTRFSTVYLAHAFKNQLGVVRPGWTDTTQQLYWDRLSEVVTLFSNNGISTYVWFDLDEPGFFEELSKPASDPTRLDNKVRRLAAYNSDETRTPESKLRGIVLNAEVSPVDTAIAPYRSFVASLKYGAQAGTPPLVASDLELRLLVRNSWEDSDNKYTTTLVPFADSMVVMAYYHSEQGVYDRGIHELDAGKRLFINVGLAQECQDPSRLAPEEVDITYRGIGRGTPLMEKNFLNLRQRFSAEGLTSFLEFSVFFYQAYRRVDLAPFGKTPTSPSQSPPQQPSPPPAPAPQPAEPPPQEPTPAPTASAPPPSSSSPSGCALSNNSSPSAMTPILLFLLILLTRRCSSWQVQNRPNHI